MTCCRTPPVNVSARSAHDRKRIMNLWYGASSSWKIALRAVGICPFSGALTIAICRFTNNIIVINNFM
jgi:hypothetical protein